jgi:ferrous iron transport protein B
MSLQSLLVAVIVLACSGYAAWTLMPSALRRPLARSLLKLSTLPESVARVLRKAAQPAGACGGCDSCGDSAATPAPSSPPAAKPVTFHRRLR